jgi:thiol-disulfide isomerase/thioredoxin
LSQFSRFVRSRKGSFATLIVLGVFAVVGVQTLYKKEGRESKVVSEKTAQGPNAETGQSLQNFVTHPSPKAIASFALQKADKTPLSLAAYEGELLVVNFWATWCAPCRKEMPQLDALAKRYADKNVRVIALSVDRGGAKKPEAFLNELGISKLTRAYDPSYKSARAAKLIGLPTTLLVSPEGLEIGRLAGEADWDSAPVHALLDAYLAE